MSTPTSDAVLVIVPARGGSRGIAGKNMRPLAGQPLIAHTVDAVLESGIAGRLVISSDDPAILNWAELHGLEARPRPSALAADDTTIGQVAAHVADELDWTGVVAVFQPTSPLRTPASIRLALDTYRSGQIRSLSTVVREPHLYWFDEAGSLADARPLFKERVNRQFAQHQVLRETGSIQLVDAEHLRTTHTMVSGSHLLFELPAAESSDIDTFADLTEARDILERGTIVFRVRANRVVGYGHLYHCMQLAEELAHERIHFLLVDCDDGVRQLLIQRGYDTRVEQELAADLERFAALSRKIVVNDVLDTTETEILAERQAGFMVVNIEDLGPGARHADWVVNALYPVGEPNPGNVSYGPRFATLRSEFLGLPPKEIRDPATRILLTFGGTDPSGLTSRFAHVLQDLPVELIVILGPGAREQALPTSCTVLRDVRSMAAEMMRADVIVTSAGRTVYEAAVTGTPVVVVAQNAREATHAHLGYDTGVVFLGIGTLVEDRHVREVVARLLASADLRAELSARLRSSIDVSGGLRIASRIRDMLKGL